MSSIAQRQQQSQQTGTGAGALSMLAQHAKSGSPRGLGGVGSTAHTAGLGSQTQNEPLLQLKVGGRSLSLRPGLTYTLGCGPSAHVQLMGGGVETRHAQIHNNKLRVLYVGVPQQTDSGRMIGPSTRLNGREVEVGQAAPLRHGDQIVIGSHIIRVEDMNGADSTQMQQHERDTGIQGGNAGLVGQQQQQNYIPDKERDSTTYGEKGLGLAPTGGHNLNDQQYGKGGIIEQQQTNALNQTGAGLAGAGAAYTYHEGNRPSSEQYQVRGTGEQAQQPLAIVDRSSTQNISDGRDGINQRGINDQQYDQSGHVGHSKPGLMERLGVGHGSGHSGLNDQTQLHQQQYGDQSRTADPAHKPGLIEKIGLATGLTSAAGSTHTGAGTGGQYNHADNVSHSNKPSLLERAGIVHHGSGHPGAGHQQALDQGGVGQQYYDRDSVGQSQHGLGQGGIDQQRLGQQQSNMGMTPLADYSQQQNTLPMLQCTLPIQSSQQIGQRGLDQQFGERSNLGQNQPLGQTAGGAGLVGTGVGTGIGNQQQYQSQQPSTGTTGQSLAQTGAGLAGIGAAYHDGNIPPSEQGLLPGGNKHHASSSHTGTATRDHNLDRDRNHDRDGDGRDDRLQNQGQGGLGQQQQYDQSRSGTTDHSTKPSLMDKIGLGHHGTTHTGTGTGPHTLGQGGIGQQQQIGQRGINDQRGVDNQYDQTGHVGHSKPGLMEKLGVGHGSVHSGLNDQTQLHQGQGQSGIGGQQQYGDQSRAAHPAHKPGLIEKIGMATGLTSATGGTHTGAGTGGQYQNADNVSHANKPGIMERMGITHGSGQSGYANDQSHLGRDGLGQQHSGVGAGVGEHSRYQPLEPSTASSGSSSYMLAPSYSTSQLSGIFSDMVELSGSRLSSGASRNLPHWFNLFPSTTRQELNSSHLKKWLQSAKEERQLRLAGDGIGSGASNVDSQQSGVISSNTQQLPSAGQAAKALCDSPSTDRNELTESDFVLGLLAMQAAGDIGSGGRGVDSATRGVNSLGLQSSSGWTDSARQSGNSVGGLGSGSHAQSDYALLTLLSDLCEVGGWRLGGGWETAVRYMLDSKHCAPQRRQGISSNLKQWIRAAIADHQRMQQQQPMQQQQGQGSIASGQQDSTLSGNSDSGIMGGGQVLSPLNLAHGLITTHGL